MFTYLSRIALAATACALVAPASAQPLNHKDIAAETVKLA